MSLRKPGGGKSAPPSKKGGGPPNNKKVGILLFALDGVILLGAVIMIATKPSCDTKETADEDGDYAADIPGMTPIDVQFQSHQTPQLNAFQPAQSWQSSWSSPSYGTGSTSYTGSTGYDYGSSSTYGSSSPYGSPSTSYGSTTDYYGTGSSTGSAAYSPWTSSGTSSASRPWTSSGTSSASSPWTSSGTSSAYSPWTSSGTSSAYSPWTSSGTSSASSPWTSSGTSSAYSPWTSSGTSSAYSPWTSSGTISAYSPWTSSGTSSAYSPSTSTGASSWTPTYGSVGSVTDYNSNNNIYGTTGTTGTIDSVYGSTGTSSSSSSFGSTPYYSPYDPSTSAAYTPYVPPTSGVYTPYNPPTSGAYSPYNPPASGAFSPYNPPASGAYSPYNPPASGAYSPYNPPASGAYSPYNPPASGAYSPYNPPASGAYSPYNPPASGAYSPYSPPASGASPGGQPSGPSANINPDAEADLKLIPEDRISNPNFECGVAPIKPNLRGGRIVGGSVAIPHSWPWVVHFGATDGVTVRPSCGATIVSPRHVISALHCVDPKLDLAKYYCILVGKHDSATPGKEYKFAKVRIHPMGESKKDVYFDMILATLKEELQFNDKVQAACLPPSDKVNPPGTACWVYGWGRTQDTGGRGKLKQVSIKTGSYEDCIVDHPFSKHSVKDDVAVCAGREKGSDSCQGDSGGPLTCQENGKAVLYGAVSWGDECGIGKFGVYASISFSMKWFCCILKEIPSCQGIQCDINSFVKPVAEMMG